MTSEPRRKSAAELEHEYQNGVAWAAFGEARAKATRLVGIEASEAHQAARGALQLAYHTASIECDRADPCALCGRVK
jgi:hypothetical protein